MPDYPSRILAAIEAGKPAIIEGGPWCSSNSRRAGANDANAVALLLAGAECSGWRVDQLPGGVRLTPPS